jgi:RimJ/RimL family protein N-acetyltransferase
MSKKIKIINYDIFDDFSDSKLYRSFLKLKKKEWKEFNREDYIKGIKSNQRITIVVKQKNKAIATATLSSKKDHLYLQHVFVDKKYRKRGICKYMIKEIVKYADVNKIANRLVLHVSISNKGAIKCYKSSGFIISKTIDHSDHGKEHIMIKTLKESGKGGKRVDKTVFIGNLAQKHREILVKLFEERGFTIINTWVSDAGKDRHLIYNSTPRKISWGTVFDDCKMINHVPFNSAISHKGNLSELVKEEYKYMPYPFRTRNVMYIKQMLKRYEKLSRKSKIPKTWGNKLWIIKPNDNFGGKNIKIMTTKELLDPLHREIFYSNVAQKYIEKPLLLEGRKFDLRIYVLFTQEFELYLYPLFQIRRTSIKYDLKTNDIGSHITNYSHQKKLEGFNSETSVGTEKLFWNLYNKEYKKDLDLMGKVKTVVVDLFDRLKEIISMYRKGESYELFGLDFMLDKDLNVFLLEVNINPGLADINEDLNVQSEKLLDDTLKLTIDKVFDNSVKDTEYLLLKKYE